MFLSKLADLTLRAARSATAGGRFSKSVVGLYGYVHGHEPRPSVQLVTELNTTHMLYTWADPSTLALAPAAKAAAGSAEVY